MKKCCLLILFCTVFTCLQGSMPPPSEWMTHQINADLRGIVPEELTEAFLLDKYQSLPSNFTLIQIRDGVATTYECDKKTELDFRERLILQHLNAVSQTVRLPNCIFLMDLGDGVISFSQYTVQVPFLCYSKKKSMEKLILFPDPDSLSSWETLQKEVKIGQGLYPWSKKKNKAIWRGSTTGVGFTRDNFSTFPRFQLVKKSLDNPKWVNARFTGIGQGAEKFEDKLKGYKGNALPVHKHLQYKYQILVDGNSCAWSRAYWQLFSNCLMIKQDSDLIQWFYGALKPGKHYLPVASDFHNLIRVLRWAKKHDREASKISANARRFAKKNLQYSDMQRYTYHLLVAYSNLQHQA